MPGTQTAEQVAARFGVTPRTVYKWRTNGLIQGARVGHWLVFSDTEVARFQRDRFAGLDLQDVAS